MKNVVSEKPTVCPNCYLDPASCEGDPPREVAPGYVLCPRCPGLQRFAEVEKVEDVAGPAVRRKVCGGIAALFAEDQRKGDRRRGSDRGPSRKKARAKANWEPLDLGEVTLVTSSPIAPKDRYVNVMVSREMDGWLAEQAAHHGTNQSTVIRMAVRQVLIVGPELPTHTPRSTWASRRKSTVRLSEETWQALKVVASTQGHKRVGRLVAIMVDHCTRKGLYLEGTS